MNYSKLAFENVNLTSGFFADRQRLNRDVTLFAVRDRFEDTGRFNALKCDWKEGDSDKPHIFWDSDIAKWVESAAFILQKEKNPALEAYIDGIVELIDKNRQPDGYFNSYFMVVEPDNRFCIRDAHELYCAGHLIEAAVAYHKATGKDRFLNIMCDYVRFIERAFVTEKTAEYSTPGHEEIELALVKLYEHTGNEEYLKLSLHFINARGQADSVETSLTEPSYNQSHKPVREQSEAVGHSVRACYLYSAMADLARITDDSGLLKACRALFNDIIDKKMYITGGIGSTHNGERFTVAYDLPNSLAYSETCAAISLCYFAQRMSLVEPVSVYADIVERTLFNSIISGISLDGKSFFYENPLEINMSEREFSDAGGYKQRFPITQRVEVFYCSCCPPNITRLFSSVGDYIYSYSDDTLYVHQYFANNAVIEKGGKSCGVSLFTDYPNSGSVKLTLNGGFERIAVRIPSWCSKYSLKLGGRACEAELKNGYAYISIAGKECELEIEFCIEPVLYAANAAVIADSGKVALMRGPVVYCLEGVDNPHPLDSLSVSLPLKAECVFEKELGTYICEADGFAFSNDCLYSRVSDSSYKPVKLRFIPYFAFANRGESDMRVWVNHR